MLVIDQIKQENLLI